MACDARVTQIRSDGIDNVAYMNIVENAWGSVSVWGCAYKLHTILVLEGINFYFYQFDSDEYFDEWMFLNKNKYNKIYSLEYNKYEKQIKLELLTTT